MTAVGWVGLGKLGLPCALALGAVGHDVCGTDLNPAVEQYLTDRAIPYQEEHADRLLAKHDIVWCPTVGEVVARSDVIFVAAQTPHAPDYGGEQPAPQDRRDFEYGYLRSAVAEVCAEASAQQANVTVVVVSTVLPGTFDRYLRPLANGCTTLVYNPFFIAMGTTIADFTRPEFVLIGTDGPVPQPLADVYEKVHDRPIHAVSIATAELTKVAYNTFIGLKIAFANTMMEVCEATGADVDDLTAGLALATDRIISPRYLRAGMGDGGGCHPRDNIAMSWLAERAGVSFDLFGAVIAAREAQSGWLADHVESWARLTGLPVVLCGAAYKPGTTLRNGSPALLLAHQLTERGICFELLTEPTEWPIPQGGPMVYVITTAHHFWPEAPWPTGSVVIDPHGYIPDRPGVTVVRLGRKRAPA